MTPELLLLSWRARWGKPSGVSLLTPYAQGRLTQWMSRLHQSQMWTLPGFSALCLACCGMFFLIAPSVQLSLNGQIVWGILLFLFAVGARRYGDEVFMWLLAGVSLVVTTRYFYWRGNTTLDAQLSVDFLLGFVLLVAEFYLWCFAALAFVKHNVFDKMTMHVPSLDFALEVMRFYRPAVQAILVALPLLALVLRLPIVHASPAALAAYALPHWILGVFFGAAQEANGRLPLKTLMREYLAALSVLRRTVVSYVRIEWQYGFGRLRPGMLVNAPGFSRVEQFGFGARLALYGVVFVGTCAREGSNLLRPENGMYVIYLIWVGYNALLVVADMAAGKEAGMVRKVLQEESRLSAMVRLPTGHLLACRTENFPAAELALRFPAESIIPVGALHISLFKGHREYTFAAHLRRQQGPQAWLVIDAACVDEYQALGRAVFSRNAAWPEWLPGRDADRVLPLWTHRFIEALESAFYNQIMRFSKHSLWQLCFGWFKRGK
jgi:hypothetical protein